MFFFANIHPWLRKNGVYLSTFFLFLVTMLSLAPFPQGDGSPYQDKILHVIAYCGIIFPCSYSRPQYSRLWLIGLFGWGAGIEIIQPYVERSAELLDLLCNGIGSLLGVLSSRLVLSFLDTNRWPSDE